MDASYRSFRAHYTQTDQNAFTKWIWEAGVVWTFNKINFIWTGLPQPLWLIIVDQCLCDDMKSTSGSRHGVHDCWLTLTTENVHGFSLQLRKSSTLACNSCQELSNKFSCQKSKHNRMQKHCHRMYFITAMIDWTIIQIRLPWKKLWEKHQTALWCGSKKSLALVFDFINGVELTNKKRSSIHSTLFSRNLSPSLSALTSSFSVIQGSLKQSGASPI